MPSAIRPNTCHRQRKRGWARIRSRRAMLADMKDKGPSPDLDKIELHADDWERFERAIKTIARHPSMHRKEAPEAKRSVVAPHAVPPLRALRRGSMKQGARWR
jgi:hypothetical protein